MPNWILTGIAAGLAAAAMQAAVLVPSLLSVFIFLLSSLPLFFVGLSRGWASAAIGSVLAAVLLMFFANFQLAVSFFLTAGLAPVLASMFSMISRDAAASSSEGEVRTSDREWYPEGRLVLWLAGIAALITMAAVLTIATDYASYTATISKMVGQLLDVFEKGMPADRPRFPRADAVGLVVNFLPVFAAAMWLFAMVLSMRLAIFLLSFKNMALRPWAKFSQMAFPSSVVFAFFLILAIAYFTTGLLHILMLCAVGAIISAFVLLGLAVVHGLVENNSARPMLLGLLYTSLFLFSWLVAIPLTFLGLFDLNFNFRKLKNNQS